VSATTCGRVGRNSSSDPTSETRLKFGIDSYPVCF
jgi:hypothetical protein